MSRRFLDCEGEMRAGKDQGESHKTSVVYFFVRTEKRRSGMLLLQAEL